jgi:hypothetical protein
MRVRSWGLVRNRGRTGKEATDGRAEEVCGGFTGRLLIRCCIGGYSSGRNRISSEEWYNCYFLIGLETTTSNEPEQSVMRRIFQKKTTYALTTTYSRP